MNEIEEVAEESKLPKIKINPTTVKKVAIVVGVTAGVITAGVIGYKIGTMLGNDGADLVEAVENAAFTTQS